MTVISDHASLPARPAWTPTICLDFDGVLHGYSRGWQDGTIYDPPVPGSVEAVRSLAGQFTLVVSTCRQPVSEVAEWITEHFGLTIPVTNMKPAAAIYLDDRGMHFDGDWEAAFLALHARAESLRHPAEGTG